ncbi:hypothetical protein EGW08_006421, partial [Elysia chlorotica]
MSGKGSTYNFKRGVSQTSSNSGGASALSNGHQDTSQKKKWPKSRQGADYMMGGGQTPASTSKAGLGQSKNASNGTVARNNLDVTSENVAGGMSVKDIEVTMSEEEESSTPQSKSPRSSDQVSSSGAALVYTGSTTADDLQKNAEKLSIGSIPTKCLDPLCASCLWHQFVLERPHRVQWMAKTVRVELVRQVDRAWPGFSHKLKKHKQTDEIYIIVTNIASNGIALESGLCVGDLILSVNNIPLQMDKISAIEFEKNDRLVFQIQHPEALSPEAAEHFERRERKPSSGSSKMIPPETKIRMQQPQTPSTSPMEAFIISSPTSENIPLFPLTKMTHRQYQPLPQATIFVCGNSTSEFVNCFVGDRINSFVQLNSCAFCFEISLKLHPSSPFSLNSIVTIDNLESFSYLFNENKKLRVQENPYASQLSCINVRLVVVEDDNFFLNCCPWMFSANSLFILTFDTTRLLSSSELEMSRLSRIACAVRTGLKGQRRLDNRAAVIPQAFSPVVSAQSTGSGGHPSLMMVGIETSQASDIEEIRALFYTSLGEALPRPDIIPVRQGQMSPEMTGLRRHVFLILNGYVTDAHVSASTLAPPAQRNATNPHFVATSALTYDSLPQSSQPKICYATALALDTLPGHQSLTISQRKMLKILQESSPSPLFEESSA